MPNDMTTQEEAIVARRLYGDQSKGVLWPDTVRIISDAEFGRLKREWCVGFWGGFICAAVGAAVGVYLFHVVFI
jgi:hypothetical protein